MIRKIGMLRNRNWIFSKAKQPPNLREFIDYEPEFLKTLSKEESAWLHDFCDAHYTGAKNAVSATWTPAEMRDSYGRNNRRLRDIYNQQPRTNLKVLKGEGHEND